MKYCYYAIFIILLVSFMMYTARHHFQLYKKLKRDRTVSENEKKSIYCHGVIHVIFALCLSFWFINVSIHYFNKKPYLFYIKIK